MSLKSLILLTTHGGALALGFAAGIYVLPILIAPEAPDTAVARAILDTGEFAGTFERDREGSNAIHWGEGEFSIGPEQATFVGRLAPGPDYKLYLSPTFVETRAGVERVKADMALVGDVRTFENFAIPLPAGIDPAKYGTAVIWCEAFGQYITSGRYGAR